MGECSALCFFFFSSRRRHTRFDCDWSSDVCSSDLGYTPPPLYRQEVNLQDASTCKNCHLDITEQWERSAHSKAERSNNQLFGRMYWQSLRVTRGATMVSCGPCHEPSTFVNQDFNSIRQVSREGVNCVFCHMVSGPGPSTGNPPLELDLTKFYGTVRNPTPTPS